MIAAAHSRVRVGTDAAPDELVRRWSLVVEEVDAPTARACVFTAAVLAAEAARRVPQDA